MRYAIAAVGAAFVFVAVFLLTTLVVAFLPAALRPWIQLGVVRTNNPIGLLLAGVAAVHSWRSTVRHYAIKERNTPKSTDGIRGRLDTDGK